MRWQLIKITLKGERSSEFYETFFELEGVRGEEKGAFLEQNISLAVFYNIKLKNHQKKTPKIVYLAILSGFEGCKPWILP